MNQPLGGHRDSKSLPVLPTGGFCYCREHKPSGICALPAPASPSHVSCDSLAASRRLIIPSAHPSEVQEGSLLAPPRGASPPGASLASWWTLVTFTLCWGCFFWSVPHALAQPETLQTPHHKLPPGPGQTRGTHHPSEKHLQIPSGFSPKKLPELQVGSLGLIQAHREGLHPSSSGLAQAAAG